MPNIFPLHMIKAAQDTNIMVELKSGQTYNGVLKGVDKFMNVRLQNSVRTDSKGEQFHEVKDVYIRGNTLKYFTFDSNVVQKLENTKYVCPESWKKSQEKYKKNAIKKKAKV